MEKMKMMDLDNVERMARDWCEAWNQRDLDAVIAHYADDVEVCSPLVKRRYPDSDGWLSGKAALRDYFAIGMGNPDLHFTFQSVRLGLNAACVLYARESGIEVSDTMEFDESGKVARMNACYSGGETRV